MNELLYICRRKFKDVLRKIILNLIKTTMMEKEKNIRHFYSYLERAIRENWESPALTDYGGENSYT